MTDRLHPRRDVGGEPESPTDIPRAGWHSILRRSVREFKHDDVTDRAAALTYFGVLAIFPALRRRWRRFESCRGHHVQVPLFTGLPPIRARRRERLRLPRATIGQQQQSARRHTSLAWERNIDSNLGNGDPYIYEHAARIPAGARSPSRGSTGSPVVITVVQANGNAAGGVKSLDADVIPGYNRGTGNDFPRLAVDRAHDRVVFVWNDASRHPLGDIWLRSSSLSLQTLDATRPSNPRC